jgi:hypothetical protein
MPAAQIQLSDGQGYFDINLSAPLVLEYEEVRMGQQSLTLSIGWHNQPSNGFCKVFYN